MNDAETRAGLAPTPGYHDARSIGDQRPPATLLGCPVLGHAGQLVEIDATIVRSPNAAR